MPKRAPAGPFIETPKGCRNKFDYDRDSGLFMLGGLLPEGMMFPYDFGFIPSTLGEEGDPLDILVLMDALVHFNLAFRPDPISPIVRTICARQSPRMGRVRCQFLAMLGRLAALRPVPSC